MSCEDYDLLSLMKKISAILLLSVYLFSTTGFSQMLKLPVLIHHYFEHIQEDDDISFIDFFSKHYTGKINHHHQGSEQQEHKNLPFKSADIHFLQIAVIVQPYFSQTDIPLWLPAKKQRHPNQQDYSTNYLNTIWQPPRV